MAQKSCIRRTIRPTWTWFTLLVGLNLAPLGCRTWQQGTPGSINLANETNILMLGRHPLASRWMMPNPQVLQTKRNTLNAKLKAMPRNVETLLALARLHVLAGDSHAAEPLARQILKIDFRNRPAKVVLAQIAFLQKNKEAERAILRQLGEENAVESEALVLVAQRAWENHEPAKAESILQRSIKLTPDDIAARMNLALIYLRQERLAEAKEQLKQILNRVPDHPDALTHLGIVHAQQGEPGKAIQLYEQARRRFPDSEIAGYNLALAQRRAGRNQDAIATLREVLNLKNLSLAGHDAAMAQLERIKMAIAANSNITDKEIDRLLSDAREKRPTRQGGATGEIYQATNIGVFEN